MLDIYVYYPRRLELTPPRQVGQVLAPSRYADQGVSEQEHTAGRDAEDAWVSETMQRRGRQQRRSRRAGAAETPAEPADEAGERRVADRRSADRRSSSDEPPRSGGTIDTFV